ncbi:PD-(D/E)XK nuclease family protein [Pyrobaculum sp. 3827-6]|uniref:PD-(D/E)XK nuclease family protein n=1 Tax=Pyrobaculum sp. 3827-6 TaxID=2983604 RepID=UPI0021D7DBC4|nr:PD-(D/E)XK nuclease family protein [Pyrobaculum sp. 3827-6]MCU7788743.1 PD-(D/E)XK nuclease family protein [Pyrobaculum sp. 3827-6]
MLEHPEILVEVLTAKPHIVYEALAKLLPWEKLMKEIEEIKNAMATKEDLKAFATKEDLRAFATNEDLKAFATKEDLKVFATKEDLAALERRLSLRIEALGAMWGVWSEEAFREGVRELLREAGYVVERWTYFDDKGQVYGYPSEVELDVVVKDGKTFLVEIVSAVRRAHLAYLRRKTELYQDVTGRRVEGVYVITPFIHDKNPPHVIAAAQKLGIRIIKPEEAPGP